jgi:hypothetical protein
VIPRDWKEANVTPIFKKGSKSSPGNYIPVSLTNAVNKHLIENRLIKKSQSSSLQDRSCTSNWRRQP